MWKQYAMAVLAMGLWACAPEKLDEEREGEQSTEVMSQRLVQAVGPLQQARYQHTSTRLQDGRVLFVGGGINTGGAVTATAEVYDPVTQTTSWVAPMQTARRGHTAVLLQDGSVLVLGGVGTSWVLSSVERYNAVTNTWTVMTPMPRHSYGHSAALLADGRVLVVGGDGYQADTHIFDPTTNTWTATGSLAQGRMHHAALRLPDNRILVMGGMGSTEAVSTSVELYDPVTGTWSTRAPFSFSHTIPSAVLSPDGRVLLGGGDNQVERYDVSTNTWTTLPQLIRNHYQGILVLTNGQPVIVAGFYGEQAIEQFNLAQQQWSIVGQLSIHRQNFTVDVLTDGSVLIVGGARANTYEPYATMDLLTSASTCTPVTCASQGAQCGGISDGCGGTLQCGTCGSGYTCGNSNTCVPANSFAYSASNTNSAQQNTTNRTLILNAGDTLEVGTCNLTGAAASGDTYLRLFGVGGAEVASNDDSCGGVASFIRYTVPTSGTYEVRAGCFSANSCSGTVVFNVVRATTLETLTYSASSTNSAQQNTINRTVTLKAGDKLEVGTCNLPGATASGDTYLRLFGTSATEVTSNDDSCGVASYLQYTAPTTGSYELRAGCFGGTSCSGTVVFKVTPGS
jgi:hypothetical protein